MIYFVGVESGGVGVGVDNCTRHPLSSAWPRYMCLPAMTCPGRDHPTLDYTLISENLPVTVA